jgi:hypothetical protein
MKRKMTLEEQADVAIISAAKILLKRRDAEIARLRAALEAIAKYHEDEIDSACAEIARKALTNEQEGK